jgi:hypothetical protein
VDDILLITNSEAELNSIHTTFNSLHKNIFFTVEREKEGIPFLDVFLTRSVDGLLSRNLYHKDTWKGQYLHFKSFAPIAYKRGLVKTLFDRARRISTFDKLPEDLKLLQETLSENGYPMKFIEKYAKIRINEHPILTAPRKNVFIRLPFKGDDVSTIIKGD